MLLASGVDVESRDSNNRTALYTAAANNQSAVVQLLCESKANVNVYGFNKWTPLTAAARNGHVEVIKVLLKYGKGVNLEMKDDTELYRHTPLYHAVVENHPEIVSILCKAGADVNASQGNKYCYGILEVAKSPEVIKTLKKYGAK